MILILILIALVAVGLRLIDTPWAKARIIGLEDEWNG